MPELLFEADVERSFRFFMRRTDGRVRTAEQRARLTAFRTAMRFFRPKEEDGLLSPEALAVYVEAYRRSGFRGPINWYRNLEANWRASAGLPDHVGAPALMITAECDPFLPPSLAEGMERYVPDLETVEIAGAGHWIQQERPEAVNRILLDWLECRFPLGGASERP